MKRGLEKVGDANFAHPPEETLRGSATLKTITLSFFGSRMFRVPKIENVARRKIQVKISTLNTKKMTFSQERIEECFD